MKQKTILLLTLVFGLSFITYSQKAKWVKIDQSYYGMKYELPKSWEVDGFSSSSVCSCSGTINIGDRYGDNQVYMVAYPANTKEELYSGIRTEVWNWKFEESETRTVYNSEAHKYELTKSKWTDESTDEDERDMVVWRFITTFKKQHYVIYFSANPVIMKFHEATIFEIINRFRPLKSKSTDW